MGSADELVILLPSGQAGVPENPYGRFIANAGVYRALARDGGYRHVHFLCRTPPDPKDLAAQLGLDETGPTVSVGPLQSTARAARSGTLLSGQPYLTEPAWVRRYAGHDTDYSIVGTIFAFASATHREQMMQSALAPLYEWDALVCSSPSLRSTVERTFDEWEDYLGERLGTAGGNESTALAEATGIRLPRPQLPVIPFGTDVDALQTRASDRGARESLRGQMGIAADDVMIYFLGRLSYYDKAFPQAMFKAVASASRDSAVATHFVLAGWFPEGDLGRTRFEQAAKQYAPGVRVTFLDGNDAGLVARCWAAADLFLLLSDTILETFGQALVEAMAAGLPLVVSDWDGYRSIVRDGVDGFLVPTLASPGSPIGESVALLQSLELVSYPQYAGAVAQHTAVDIGSAARALRQLIESPHLRRTMGEEGRRRAREVFAWQVVAAQYTDLFAELAERRRCAVDPDRAQRPGHRLNPLRADPFAVFRDLPTALLTDDVLLTPAPDGSPGAVRDLLRGGVELDRMFPGVRGDEAEAVRVVESLVQEGPRFVRDLLAAFPPARRPFVRMTVLWLAKAGLVEWSVPS